MKNFHGAEKVTLRGCGDRCGDSEAFFRIPAEKNQEKSNHLSTFCGDAGITFIFKKIFLYKKVVPSIYRYCANYQKNKNKKVHKRAILSPHPRKNGATYGFYLTFLCGDSAGIGFNPRKTPFRSPQENAGIRNFTFSLKKNSLPC